MRIRPLPAFTFRLYSSEPSSSYLVQGKLQRGFLLTFLGVLHQELKDDLIRFQLIFKVCKLLTPKFPEHAGQQSSDLTLNLSFVNSDTMEFAMSEDITYPGPFAYVG